MKLLGVVLMTALLLATAACGADGGQTQATKACSYVERSLKALAVHHNTEARELLEEALPLASAANTSSGEWAGLMTTIQEIHQTTERHLVGALRRECTTAHPGGQPSTGFTVPPTSSGSA